MAVMDGTNASRSPSRPRGATPWLAALVAAASLAACGGSSPTPVYPGIYVSKTSLATVEGGANVTFDVRLATAPRSSVYVDVCSGDTTEGYLKRPTDLYTYDCVGLTFTTSNWSTVQTIAVVPYNDTITDGNQTYAITASVDTLWTVDSTYTSVPPRTINVTNADNDVPAFTVSETMASTSETGTTDTFTVVLNTPPTATVTIPVTATDSTEGLLRGGSSPTVSVPTLNLTFTTTTWSTPQTVTIYGQNDLVDDGNQTYNVTVGPPTGDAAYAALPQKTVSVTNTDDDTVGITVTATPVPLVTSENGTTATFTVKLNTQPLSDVVVAVKSANVAEGLVSAGLENLVETAHLTFTSTDWNVAQTVTVTGQDEVTTPVPGDNVTYDVTVGPATGDAAYAALATQAVSVLNTDNDTAAVIVPAAVAGLQTTETGAGNTVTFTVGINKLPTTNVVIPVTVNDVSEGLVMGGSSPAVPVATLNLTFTPSDFATAQTVTVIGQVDNVVDGNQTYTITVGVPTGDSQYTSLPAQSIAATNADTDVAGFTVTQSSGTSTPEGGAVDTFTVVLNRAPMADVVVPVTSGNPAEGKLMGGDSGGLYVASLNLTFTPANWSTAQTVSVQGQTDSIDDGDQIYTITAGPTSSLSAPYNGLAAKTISATNTDVDVAGFTVTPQTGLSVTEGGATASFTVVLNTKPLATVNLPVTAVVSSQALVSSSAYPSPVNYLSLSFTASDWNVPQTVTVTAVDDGNPDGDAPWTVSVGPTASGDTKYGALAAKTVSGVAHDNDATNQGGVGTPISLTLGMLPSASQVGAGSSYYVLSGLTPGVGNVALTGVNGDVSLYVYSSADFTTGLLCSSTATGITAGEMCSFTVPASGIVYIKVSAAGSTTGAAFSINANVTLTWASTDVPKAITDYTTVYSTVTVAGGPTTITKVTVKIISLTHTFAGDLDIYIKSPAGTEIALSTDNGGGGANYTNTVFDDAATTSITLGAAPFTGPFKPETLLSTFNGQNANGVWTLRVYDHAGGDVGTLNSWSITLN
jgi:subtilisin-like proprotein convertase family protein